MRLSEERNQKNTTNHPEEQKEDMPEENTVEITTKMDETILLDYYKNMFPIKTPIIEIIKVVIPINVTDSQMDK